MRKTASLRGSAGRATSVGRGTSEMSVDKPSAEPAKAGNVDIEAFSRNIARMIEEGGKALAAYLKPREEGKIKGEISEDITDAVKSVGRVAEYWMSDPRRALELQTSLGRAYLDLWASAVKRMAGEKAEPAAAPDPKDKRFADPEWTQINSSISLSKPICSPPSGASASSGMPLVLTSTPVRKPNSTSGR